MVTYTKLTVSGTTFSDVKSALVKNSIGEYNASCRLECSFDNKNGLHKSDLPAGASTLFWAGQVPTNGLTAYYPFTGNAKDEIGSNDGTVTGATLTSNSAGKNNCAYSFDGNGDYIDLNSSVTATSITFVANFTTVASKIFFTNTAGTRYIGADASGFLLFNDGSNRTTTVSVALGAWTQYSFSHNGTGYDIYVNGAYSQTVTCSELSLQRISTTSTNGFTGTMDEVGFYSRALNGQEAKNIYNGGNLTTCTKIFNGIVTQTTFTGNETTDAVTVTARDWTAALQNVQVVVEVYTNQEISTIVTDLMTKYGPPGITTTNVNVTPVTLSRIQFKQISLFDALKQLSDLALNYFFYVDVRKDLHFQILSGVNSAVTLDNSNSTRVKFTQNVDNVKNQIFVYGDKFFSSYPTETFTSDGLGSSYTLQNIPYNTKVTLSGTGLGSVLVGGVYNQTTTPSSGIQYLTNQLDKKIIFVTGTSLGYSSIPASGAKFYVDYQNSLPIVKRADDFPSQSAYGIRTETVINTDIQDPNLASSIAKNRLALKKNPTIEGTLNLQGVVLLNAGESVTVNFPNQNQASTSYTIISTSYNFNLNNNFYDEVLTVQVSRKVGDVTDILKKIINDVKKVQAAQIDNSSTLTRLLGFTGSIGLSSTSGVHVRIGVRTVNDSWILGHAINGVIGNVGSKMLYWKYDTSGTWIADTVLGVSGQNVNGAILSGVSHYTFGSALLLNGSNSYMRFVYPGSFISANNDWSAGSSILAASGAGSWAWSVNTWAYFNGSSLGPSGANNMAIIGNRAGDNFVFSVSGNGIYTGTGSFQIIVRTDDSAFTQTVSQTLSGQWVNLGFSWRLNSRLGTDTGSPFYPYCEMYVNGSQVKAGSYLYATGQPFAVNTGGSIYWGYDERQGWALNGLLSDGRIYPRFIGSEEHSAIYRNSISGLQPIMGDRRATTYVYSGA